MWLEKYNLNSSERFEPGPGFEAQEVERQARELEVRSSNPGPGWSFSLELKKIYILYICIKCKNTVKLAICYRSRPIYMGEIYRKLFKSINL